MRILILPAIAGLMAFAGGAQAAEPVKIPGLHGGYAAYADAEQKADHDPWGFAGAYRAGDYVFLSGVVAGSGREESIDVESFKKRLRSMFQRADETLKAADASLADVVELNSFHVFDSPRFTGDKLAHFNAVAEIKKEFMSAADPAWTAIGVSALLPDSGLVEIRMVAYAPLKSD